MTVEEVVKSVVEFAEQYSREAGYDDLPAALSRIEGFSPEGRRMIRQRLAEILPSVEAPAGAGFLAVWLGAEVEDGADPKISGPRVLAALINRCRGLSDLPVEDSENIQLDEDLRTGLELMSRAAVAHLARDTELLESLRTDPAGIAILEAAENWSYGPMWVMQILRQRSGEVIVLHGVWAKGFRVRYENLSNCFHFFTLLQGALGTKMPGGYRARREVIAVARGTNEAVVHDQAWWHYGQGSSPVPELATMIFGEADLGSIESYEGTQLILLWPPILQSRGWDGGFFTPHLVAAPPAVDILRELDRAEVDQWRQRLSLPKALPKPWWRPG